MAHQELPGRVVTAVKDRERYIFFLVIFIDIPEVLGAKNRNQAIYNAKIHEQHDRNP
jgi:hypothetical protein